MKYRTAHFAQLFCTILKFREIELNEYFFCDPIRVGSWYILSKINTILNIKSIRNKILKLSAGVTQKKGSKRLVFIEVP